MIEKIRKEIVRLKNWNNNVRNSTRNMTTQEEDYNRGKNMAYDEMLELIDHLQSNNPWDRVDINSVIKVKVKETGEILEGFYNGKGYFDHFVDHNEFERYSIDEVELLY